jgi:hypothetical protein
VVALLQTRDNNAGVCYDLSYYPAATNPQRVRSFMPQAWVSKHRGSFRLLGWSVRLFEIGGGVPFRVTGRGLGRRV